MMSTKLDGTTSRYWEEHRNNMSEPPTLSQFCTFLGNRADLLETLEDTKGKIPKAEVSKPRGFLATHNSTSESTNSFKNKCPLCKSDHLLYTCEKFRELTVESRIAKAREFKVCLNCLRPGHSHIKCKLSHCRYCKYKHNTLLHLNKQDSTIPTPTTSLPESVPLALHANTSQTQQHTTTTEVALPSNTSQPTTSPQILLSTALVKVLDKKGNQHDARLLLDNGSTANFISQDLCSKLGLSSRATHSTVSDLTKEAYRAALLRFFSRRGKCRSITSDNATTFVGACNELHKLVTESSIGTELADEGIKFIFTPPYSPHMNGIAEAAVRSTKYHLKRILNLTHFTYEEMSTCLTQIEAILNSRPITPISTDPQDFCALTPAHFLIGRTLTSIPCQQIAETTNLSLLQRHKRVELIKQHFWTRFTNDYISTLQQKTKWHSGSNDLKENSLVLIKDKMSPPLLWSLGRILKVYPGVDGINRVAEIKTKKGTIRRGWNNICLLPLEDNL
ncbi:uncharacterized protein LOC105380138 isoform X2 [Plutella xylostella]|uniref:uncharacterized protein LOC105380138 isoform X2 n=1 Tax=Plutella xylostella TaxID=51655 RepID=UPI002032D4E1|nr:uncharacterized protein LOC105380138 isoform X2 [Plutella xylostella]